jgi:hypothetical protein
MSNRNKLTVITTAPKKRSYGDFDEWMKIVVDLSEWRAEIWEMCDTLEQQPNRIEVVKAALIAKRYTDHDIETMLVRWKSGDDWYNHPELYDDQGGVKHQIVSEQVALLVGSFRNVWSHSPEVYTRMLIAEIYLTRVNACVLESVCRSIRRTLKRLPDSPAEALQMIEEEQKLDLDLRHDDSDDLAEIVKEFCELRDNLLEAIAEAKRKLAKG